MQSWENDVILYLYGNSKTEEYFCYEEALPLTDFSRRKTKVPNTRFLSFLDRDTTLCVGDMPTLSYSLCDWPDFECLIFDQSGLALRQASPHYTVR